MKYTKIFTSLIISFLFTNNSQAQTVNYVQEVVSHLLGIRAISRVFSFSGVKKNIIVIFS